MSYHKRKKYEDDVRLWMAVANESYEYLDKLEATEKERGEGFEYKKKALDNLRKELDWKEELTKVAEEMGLYNVRFDNSDEIRENIRNKK